VAVKVKLSNEGQIDLTYLRHLTTFQLLGIQFGVMNQPTRQHLITGFHPHLAIKFTRNSKKNASDYEIVQEILTEYELIVDSSEQPRERPAEYKQQQNITLARRKNPFKKSNTVLPDGQDVDVIGGVPGPCDILCFL